MPIYVPGGVERSHLTLAQRLTPYVEPSGRNWQNMLPAIVFAINNSVSSSTGHSPHGILFGNIPKSPLSSPKLDTEFSNIPENAHAFVKQQTSGRMQLRLRTGWYRELMLRATIS